MFTIQELLQFGATFVGRQSDYAVQQADGRYRRMGHPVTHQIVRLHLEGKQTIGTYVIDEQGLCRFAVFDADQPDGLHLLYRLQTGPLCALPSYLEQSRRGGHLWVFLAEPLSASVVRDVLLPVCPADVEFYPKQNGGRGYGSLIRLPLGIHRRSGERYPFVEMHPDRSGFVPCALSLHDMLAWLADVERVSLADLQEALPDAVRPAPAHTSITKKSSSVASSPTLTITQWCAAQDPFAVIGRYVDLDRRGMGCCPFGEHHADGKDSHPSFRVYEPSFPGGCCWYCYTWGYGGNVFNFLARYHRLDAKTLWRRLLAGEQF